MKKNTVVPKNPCIGGHIFQAVDVTPKFPPITAGLGGIGQSMNPIRPEFKLYCSRCGEVREMK